MGGQRRDPGAPHTVYVMRDYTGDVLYVGLTGDIGERLLGHSSSQPWFLELARVDCIHFNNRPDAAARERELIRDLNPRYNVAHQERGAPGVRSSDSGALVTVPVAAEMLGFKSRDPIYDLVRSGDLEQVHIGKASRIVVASIDAYVQRLREPKPVTLRRLPRVAS